MIVDNNCPFPLCNSEYIPKFLKAFKTPETDIEKFYDSKVTKCVKEMGWEKTEKNKEYFAEVGSRGVSIDSVDIGNKRYTIVVMLFKLFLKGLF